MLISAHWLCVDALKHRDRALLWSSHGPTSQFYWIFIFTFLVTQYNEYTVYLEGNGDVVFTSSLCLRVDIEPIFRKEKFQVSNSGCFCAD